MGFPRQEYKCSLPFPSPGNPPNPGIKFRSPAWQADSLPSEPPGRTLTNTDAFVSFLEASTENRYVSFGSHKTAPKYHLWDPTSSLFLGRSLFPWPPTGQGLSRFCHDNPATLPSWVAGPEETGNCPIMEGYAAFPPHSAIRDSSSLVITSSSGTT